MDMRRWGRGKEKKRAKDRIVKMVRGERGKKKRE